MAYTQFKNDLFVSYRRAANEAHDNWVDTFCAALRSSLVELVGDVSIWRDESELDAGTVWRQEIAEALNNAAIFIAIISRTYLDSDECRKELDIFLGSLKDAATGKERKIVPIFKQPLKAGQELPRELGELHRHEFFRWDPPGSRNFRELGPDPTSASAGAFWETLSRVAQDLMVALEDLRGEQRTRALGTVFVARVGPELSDERERLRSDLQLRGYIVVPEHEYLWNSEDFREHIDADLAAARLCIHLVARTDSIEPETAQRAALQLKLAHEVMKRSGRPPPLVWIQPASEIAPSAKATIDYIEGELANEGVEYWCGGLEDLKTQIYDKLAAGGSAPAPSTVRGAALLVEDGDVANLGSLKALLADKLGVDPQTVKFSAAAPQDAARLARTLAACDRCFLIWGAQPEDWVHDVLANAALATHLSRERMCVYAIAPSTPEKSTFRSPKASAIVATDDVHEAEVRAFVGPGPTGT